MVLMPVLVLPVKVKCYSILQLIDECTVCVLNRFLSNGDLEQNLQINIV